MNSVDNDRADPTTNTTMNPTTHTDNDSQSPEKEYKWELFFALIIMYALYFWFLYWFKETTGEPFLGNQ